MRKPSLLGIAIFHHMNMATVRRTALSGLASLVGGCMIFTLSACGGGGSSSNTSTESSTAALGTSVKNVPLVANQQAEVTFAYTVPGPITAKGDFSVNVTETLRNVSLSSAPIAGNGSMLETLRLLAALVIKDAFAQAQQQAQVTVFISHAGDPNVCSSPNRFGPYSILGAIGAALTSSTTAASPTAAVVNISNAGRFQVCIVTIPPINAYLTVTAVAVDFEGCDAPTFDVAGSTWSGTWSCSNFDASTEAGNISLTISRNMDGSYQYVDDAGAAYSGHICGNKFKFNGGRASVYTENGTLVFSSNSVARKTSIWNLIASASIGGECVDSLTRQ